MAVRRKRLPGLLYDKTTGWWFSNIRDLSKKCGRTKHMWSKDRAEAARLYKSSIERVVGEHKAKEPDTIISSAGSWVLIEMAARYYDLKASDGCSDWFLASVKRYLKRFLDWLQNHGFDVCAQGAAQLTAAHLEAYRQSLAEDTSIGIRSANHCIDYVRMLLLWGSRVHGIPHPPLAAISKFSKRQNTKKDHGRRHDRTPLSWDDLEKLLAVADITDSALIMLALNCGFGNTDIGTLKLEEVHLDAGTISHPRPKTGVERDFILWPETVQVLREYLDRHRGEPRFKDSDKLFFVSRKGRPLCWQELKEDGKVRRSDAIKLRFERLCQRAGVERKYGVGFYIIRHTYATMIGSSSKDFREVQAALGQVTIQQQEVYRHDRAFKARQAQQRLRGELEGTAIQKILAEKLRS